MSSWSVVGLLCMLGLMWTSCGVTPGNDTRPTASTIAVQQAQAHFNHPLLRDLQTYCYACHHGEPGEAFDRFSRQPAFFATASEPEVLQNVREVAGRAIRYLRATQMPKATDPALPKDKRREMIKALKALATTPPTASAVVREPVQLAQLQAEYDRQLRPSLAYKCGVCHGEEANFVQILLFGGAIQLARREWDSTNGFPFGGDYVSDPLLQLSKLEVAVIMKSMPPVYYTASFPDRQLSPDDITRIRAWLQQARTVYGAQ